MWVRALCGVRVDMHDVLEGEVSGARHPAEHVPLRRYQEVGLGAVLAWASCRCRLG